MLAILVVYQCLSFTHIVIPSPLLRFPPSTQTTVYHDSRAKHRHRLGSLGAVRDQARQKERVRSSTVQAPSPCLTTVAVWSAEMDLDCQHSSWTRDSTTCRYSTLLAVLCFCTVVLQMLRLLAPGVCTVVDSWGYVSEGGGSFWVVVVSAVSWC